MTRREIRSTRAATVTGLVTISLMAPVAAARRCSVGSEDDVSMTTAGGRASNFSNLLLVRQNLRGQLRLRHSLILLHMR